jgi:hypothetical protein
MTNEHIPAAKRLPYGISNFEQVISKGYVYVDDTSYVYKFAQEGHPYFLGRPRRFGKSLFLSTLQAYFEGKRELFEEIAGQPQLAIAHQVFTLGQITFLVCQRPCK